MSNEQTPTEISGAVVMNNGSYEEYKKLTAMKIHDEIRIGEHNKYTVLRVPGGWLYFANRTMILCFVPLTDGSKI